MKVDTKKLHALVAAANTPDERLVALAVCFLTGQMPYGFNFTMQDWGTGLARLELQRQGTLELSSIRHKCGTSGCIAGLTNFLFGNEMKMGSYDAAALLGLNPEIKGQIFVPWAVWNTKITSGDDFTKEVNRSPVKVGRVLVHYIRTGKVDWSLRFKPVKVAGRVF